MSRPNHVEPQDEPGVAGELEEWLRSDGEHTVGTIVDVFDEKAFALLFVLLLGVSALPLPTGGATHVFDILAVLIAAQLIAGRRHIWIPDRWAGLRLDGPRQQRFLNGLMKMIRRLEKLSRPRLRHLFGRRVTNALFGALVIALTAAAFFAPPFSGLDTLPALGVVVLSLGVLLEDALIAGAGILIGVAGVVLELVVGATALHGLHHLL